MHRAPSPHRPPETRFNLSAPRRVALYSHDTQGLGHVRRNITLASALVAANPATDVLLLTGSPEAAALPLPPRTDIVTLPTLHKDERGGYRARRLSSTLGEVISLRGRILTAALTGFAPDLLIVDKVARGVDGELDQSLRALRAAGSHIVLGLREVLDRPDVARREWDAAQTTEAITCWYDEVWVYGDPTVYDLAAECNFPAAVTRRLRYTGYLGNGRNLGAVPRRRTDAPAPLPTDPYLLCLVGGGQDGGALAQAFAAAPLPAGHHGVIVTGPYMQAGVCEELRLTCAARPELTLLDYVPDLERFIASATGVVSMAGYNSVCELLAAGSRTLLVPRTRPREEQAVRARSLQRRGLVDVLDLDRVRPDRLAQWFTDAVRMRAVPAPAMVDLAGLVRVGRYAQELQDGGRLADREARQHVAV